MPELPSRVEEGHPHYATMAETWRREKGHMFDYGGYTWRVVQDNDRIYFLREGGNLGLDAAYGSRSV